LIKAEECFVPGKEQMENKRGLQAQTWRSCNPVVLLGGCVSDWISIISLVEEFEFWTTTQEVELVCSNQDANTPPKTTFNQIRNVTSIFSPQQSCCISMHISILIRFCFLFSQNAKRYSLLFCLQFQVSHRKPSTNETLNKVSEECSIENPCIIHTFCIKIQKKTHISNRRPTSCNDPKFQLFSENKYSRKCVYGKRRDHMGINAESGLIKH
jgi:hypothetical protein